LLLKIINEKERNRDLVFIIENQNSIIEGLRDDNRAMKADRTSMEEQIKKLLFEVSELSLFKTIRDKAERVISYCESINNLEVDFVENLDKLGELPYKISAYLKGLSPEITIDSKCPVETEFMKAVKDIKQFLEETKTNQSFSVDTTNILSGMNHLSTEATEADRVYSLQTLPDDYENLRPRAPYSDRAPKKSRSTLLDAISSSKKLDKRLVQGSSSLLYHYGQLKQREHDQSFELNRSMTQDSGSNTKADNISRSMTLF